MGYLYAIDTAQPRREVTEAMRAAVMVAIAAKRRCHACRRNLRYIPPARTGHRCWDCVDGVAAA